jgi:hypothetical protein
VDEMSTGKATAHSVLSDGSVLGDGNGLVPRNGATVEVLLHVHGKGSVTALAAELAELPGVHAVVADDVSAPGDE